jgi:hypothetical protein
MIINIDEYGLGAATLPLLSYINDVGGRSKHVVVNKPFAVVITIIYQTLSYSFARSNKLCFFAKNFSESLEKAIFLNYP